MRFLWEMSHYALISAAIAFLIPGGWFALTGLDGVASDPSEKWGKRLCGGFFMIITGIVLWGIWQDMRLGHTCALHGTCK